MKLLFSFARWFMVLFNPPPRDSLSLTQKVGRVFLVSVVLFTCSIISALGIAVALFLFQRIEAGQVGVVSLARVLAILLDSLLVNAVCIFILFQIKRLDEGLIPRDGTSSEPKA